MNENPYYRIIDGKEEGNIAVTDHRDYVSNEFKAFEAIPINRPEKVPVDDKMSDADLCERLRVLFPHTEQDSRIANSFSKVELASLVLLVQFYYAPID